MEITEHIRALDSAGCLLAERAAAAGPDAAVPTCPGWQVRDLLRHTTMVHRWATRFVADALTSPAPGEEPPPHLDGDALVDHFAEGHRALVRALREAPDDLECWSFLAAPSPLAFWARRQAHETTVHRLDADSAVPGAQDVPVDARVAADGIDELLRCFHSRSKSRVRTEQPRVLRVRTTDTGEVWTVRLGTEPPATTHGADDAAADCELSGTAAELYAALWNRRPVPEVTGDASLARLWRENSAVNWN
ncbi:maleylpyruvate isomerase family mycothiol-dependent enzyme [Streptomyces triticagri]|uniref:Maleylpyruvate isomerase family mycothiol-dependent enzyme n=1 Tax=Streptomyces triticagri TaxID=2293568 RepID=A0A372M3F4_9ACTN|nr:maleylpyruvate isomerase family mycothiol-dependent enzyme [Streptomyces triticagri]RFU85065.1 maleylpyruvate isomerase family mycothiol-dependent enzyme [Streptomyces triticagri]